MQQTTFSKLNIAKL